ncbi:MAG: hypothetical protein MI863_14315 [Desulfobacterales bacterium]|nr:hypothetical protein [Desulfobacterales bacterium]
MYDIKVDEAKNRLYIKLGAIDTGDGQKIYNEIQQGVKKLNKGFSAVSDIREFTFSDPGEGDWAEKIIHHLAESGMAVVARVTGNTASSMERVEPVYGYRIIMVDEFNAADGALDRCR